MCVQQRHKRKERRKKVAVVAEKVNRGGERKRRERGEQLEESSEVSVGGRRRINKKEKDKISKDALAVDELWDHMRHGRAQPWDCPVVSRSVIDPVAFDHIHPTKCIQ